MRTIRALVHRVLLVAIVSVIGGLAVAAFAMAGQSPSGGGHGGKPKDGDCPSGTIGFELDPVKSGTWGDGKLSVTVTKRYTASGETFDFTSNLPIATVFVKGWSSTERYDYAPSVTAGAGLHAKVSWGGKFGKLGRVLFCYEPKAALEVSKTAKTSFTRSFQWGIDKSVTPDKWDLFTGQSGTSKYKVAVTKTGATDSGWAVFGTIKIKNPTTQKATIASVADAISGGIAATISCGVSFPYELAAGGTLYCTYAASLPDGASRTNTATVTTTGAVEGGTGTAAVKFHYPTTVVNGKVRVQDTNGTSWYFTGSGSQSYTKTFECDEDEGTYTDTATIVETGQSDSASVTVGCHALEVTKDASTSLTRKWKWTIAKSADPTSRTLNPGEAVSVGYKVVLTAQQSSSRFTATGTIRVRNPAPVDAVLAKVTDVVSANIVADVDCDVSFPYTLRAGQTLECEYSVDLPDASDRTNTATATLVNGKDDGGDDECDDEDDDRSHGKSDGDDCDDDSGKGDDDCDDDDGRWHGKSGDDDCDDDDRSHGNSGKGDDCDDDDRGYGKGKGDDCDDGVRGSQKPSTTSGTVSFSGSAAIDFDGAVVTELDECVTVTDTRKGVLGTVCAGDADKTLEYTVTFGTPGTGAEVVVGAGQSNHPNTATFVTNDTRSTGTSSATVTITVVTPSGPTQPVTPTTAIDLVLDKTASSPTPLNGTVNYRLTVTNKGPSTATNVQLADPAPAGIVFEAATPSQGACTVTPALVTCSLGSLAASQSVTVDVRGRATAIGTLTNTATVVGQGGTETNVTDNSDSAQTIVPQSLKPPTATKPKPKPKKPKRKPTATKPAASVCMVLTVTPKAISVDGRPDKIRVLVTAAKKRQRGVRVIVKGVGVDKAQRTGRQGVAVLTVNPRQPTILTVTAAEKNRKVCGTKRVGAVAAFAVPLTG